LGWVPSFWGRRCRVNYSWVGDGAAVEEDGIAQGAVVGIVGVEVEVLAGGELGDEDKRGEREALKWMAFSWRAVSRGKAPT